MIRLVSASSVPSTGGDVETTGPKPVSVGAPGFEPGTSWSQTRRANQAALRPDTAYVQPGKATTWTFAVDRTQPRPFERTASLFDSFGHASYASIVEVA